MLATLRPVVTIRAATPADEPEILACLTRLAQGSQWTQGAVLDPSHLAATLRQVFTNPDARFFVADNGESTLVGLLVLMVYAHLISGERMAGEVCWWVDPEARGRVGLHLLTEAEAQLAAEGVRRVQLLAPVHAVARVLLRRGYRVTDQVCERTLPCRG